MRVAVVGTGYVGLVSGACFADMGHDVVCVDVDPKKIDALKAGEIPIYEPGLDTIVERTVAAGRLSFTTEITEGVPGADVAVIAVGTPPRPGDGHADLRFVHAAAEAIATAMTGYTVIVDKSTVPVGTAAEVTEIVARIRDREEYDVVSNPEFLREGAAIQDFMTPPRIVVGARSEQAAEVMRRLYKPLTDRETPIVVTEPESAELIKYAANAFLAMKVTFINEVADICEKIGADVGQVARGIGMDHRIGGQFLRPGPGFGGSCFPKDTMEMAATARRVGTPTRIVETVISVNDARKVAMACRVEDACGGSLKGKKVAVLGVTFKAETDDMRDSPALTIVPELQAKGANVRAYDPQGMEEAKKLLAGIEWGSDAYETLDGADVAVIVTEWTMFSSLDLDRVKERMAQPIIVDLRNLFDPDTMKEAGFSYSSIGRNRVIAELL